jgi:hypothetical protein
MRLTNRKLLSVIAVLAMSLQMFNLYAFDSEALRPSSRYRTIKVEHLAASTGLTSTLATLPDSVYQMMSSKVKSPLRVKVQDGLVTEIGIRMFSDELRSSSSIIYDFIERLALEYTLTAESKRAELLEDLDVKCRGSFLKAVQLNLADTTVSFAMGYANRKLYNVTWQKNGREVCTLKFPASFSLLLGYQSPEGDNTVIRDMKAAPQLLKAAARYVDTLLEKSETDSIIYVSRGAFLRTKAINANVYLHRDTAGQFTPICSSLFPAESFANLLVSQQIDNDIMLDVEIEKYNRKKESLSLSLKQLSGFAAQNDLKPYIGIVSYDKDNGDIVALLELHNADCSYMHMIKIKTNQHIFDTREGTMTAEMTPFIPLQKLKQ